MDFKEYPKHLYMDGDVSNGVVVQNKAEEDAKRAEGYSMYAEWYAAQQAHSEPVKRGPGRPRKE